MGTKKETEELWRVVKMLKEKDVTITKRNISLYCNHDLLSADFISGLSEVDIKRFSSITLSDITDNKGRKIPYQFIETKKREHQEKLEAFINIIDMMVEDGIELSTKNINEMGEGIFSSAYLYYGEQAEYLKKKREETGYQAQPKAKDKVVKQEKVVEKIAEDASQIDDITVTFEGETLSDFDRDYIKDMIDTVNPTTSEFITIDTIMDMFEKDSIVSFPEDILKKDCEISDYLEKINKEKEIHNMINKVNKELATMRKNGILINKYTLLKRCSSFLSYNLVKTNEQIGELFLNL